MRRLFLAALVVGASCSFWGGVAAPANADICAISPINFGNYLGRTANGLCTTPTTLGMGPFIIVLNAGKWKNNREACAQTTEPLKGNYTDPHCITATGLGMGSFARILISTNFFGWWSVEGKDAKELPAGVQITKLTTAKATLKSKILGAEVKFTTSTTPELVGVKLEGEDKLSAGSTVRFKGITTEINGKASAACTPMGEKGKESSKGTITTKKLSGELDPYEGSGVTELLPESGSVLATFYFGETCSLPEEVSLITKKETGNGLVLTDPLGIGKELVTHEVTELAALTELWLINEKEEHKVTLEGSAAVALSGTHSGLAWKGTPTEYEVE
jgi:hypothetical protein